MMEARSFHSLPRCPAEGPCVRSPPIFCHHAAYRGQRGANGALLRLVLQQDARGAAARSAAGVGGPPSSRFPAPPSKLRSKRWRDLIVRVWHVDPLCCPVCLNPMRVIAVLDDPRVVASDAPASGALARSPAQ